MLESTMFVANKMIDVAKLNIIIELPVIKVINNS